MVFLAQEDPTERRPDEVLELLKKMHLPASTPSTGKKFNPSIDHQITLVLPGSRSHVLTGQDWRTG